MKRINLKRVLIAFLGLTTVVGVTIFMIFTFLTPTESNPNPDDELPVDGDIVEEDQKEVDEEPANQFAVLSYYHEDLLDDYIAYQTQNSDYSIEDIVTHVNMGIDEPFFTSPGITIEDPDALDVLVNKVYCLDESFVPNNLVTVDDYRGQQMVEEAAIAFRSLNDACEELGFTIYAFSGYRSIEYQHTVYNNMISVYGEEYTNTVSAKPTHSEHHTGLAVDVSINGLEYTSSDSSPYYDEFYDLLDDYGFILRYPEGSEHLTGYSYESWHLRYLGVDLAKEVLESGLTYDEFVARQ